jgi:hypothetical protein
MRFFFTFVISAVNPADRAIKDISTGTCGFYIPSQYVFVLANEWDALRSRCTGSENALGLKRLA